MLSGSPMRRIAPGWLVALAAALLVAACGGSAPTPAPTTGAALPTAAETIAPTGSASASASVAPVATVQSASPAPVITLPPVTAPPVTEPPVTAPPPSLSPAIGVPLLIGDEQYMTVLDAEQWAGTSQVKPRKGKVFYTVSIKVDALTITSFDSADFKLKDAAGHAYVWRPGRAPHLYSLNNMSAGNTYAGWITYEIPKTSLGELTLVYKPAFLVGSTYVIPLF